MEFRGKQDWPLWRTFWDVAFCAASTLATFLFGAVVGNCIHGLPLGADGDFVQSPGFFDLFGPYPVHDRPVRRGHLRHARVDLPLPQDRGRVAEAHPRLDVDDFRDLS